MKKTGLTKLFKYEKHKLLSIAIVTLCSLLAAVMVERITGLGLSNIRSMLGSTQLFSELFNFSSIFTVIGFYRTVVFFILSFFLLIHFIIKIGVFYDIIFRYRYLIATVLFFILLVNKIHFSSIGMFDVHVQTGMGTRYTAPIFGTPQAIRSDEWMITTPNQLAAQYDPEPYGRFNYIARGTATENMPNGVALNLATLAFPMSIFYIFGAEYGVSARWVGTLIMTFMAAFEFAYIISGKNRLLAAVGACLIAFSPFFQWWSYVYFVTSGLGALVCLYYFINTRGRIKRLLFSLGVVIFISQFIVTLYPAWQVPAGYLYFALAIWMIAQNWDMVKRFDKIDYATIGLAVILIAGVVATYLYNAREYIESISNTVYPGERHYTGGDMGFINFASRTMLGGVYGPIYSARDIYLSNICEFGGFYTLFPIPVLFISFMMIRKKTIDAFSIIIITFSLVVASYLFIGWPEWLARLTLISYTVGSRVTDIFVFAQVLMLIRALSLFTETPEKTEKFPKPQILAISTTIGLFITVAIVMLGRNLFIYDIATIYSIIAFFGFTAIIYSMFDLQRNQIIFKIACLYIIILSSLTLTTIHPVSKGLDAIYAKPLSAKVLELSENKDEKWISLDTIVGSSFLIANGASTISSTNFYPNLELWHQLDPERKYEYAYNRYTNIIVSLTHEETSFELPHVDTTLLNLSLNDMQSIGIKYIHTFGPHDIMDNNAAFTLLYDEGDSRIYSADYSN